MKVETKNLKEIILETAAYELLKVAATITILMLIFTVIIIGWGY